MPASAVQSIQSIDSYIHLPPATKHLDKSILIGTYNYYSFIGIEFESSFPFPFLGYRKTLILQKWTSEFWVVRNLCAKLNLKFYMSSTVKENNVKSWTILQEIQ